MFADPVARRTFAGDVVFPGHVGLIYQAASTLALGRGTPVQLPARSTRARRDQARSVPATLLGLPGPRAGGVQLSLFPPPSGTADELRVL